MILACLTANLLYVFIGLSTTEYLEMTDLLTEIKENFEEKLATLVDAFDEYDYESAEGVTKDDFNDIEKFILFIVINGKAISYSKFEKKIRSGLFSNDGADLKDFDWDVLENRYYDCIEAYTEYSSVCEQVTDNLTGDQTLRTVQILSEDEIKQKLLDYFIENDRLYEINTGSGTGYLLNDSYKNILQE